MKNFTIKIIFIIFLHQQINTKLLLKALMYQVYQYEKISQINMQDKNKTDYPKTQNQNKFEKELATLEKLANELNNGLEPIGKGQFGKVFEITGNILTKKKRKVVVKEIQIDNDLKTEQGKIEQIAFYSEIKIARELTNLDINHLFFPVHYGTFEVTNYFPTFVNKSTSISAKQYLEPKQNKELFLVFNEYLDFDLFYYLFEEQKNSYIIYPHIRLLIAYNLLKAMDFISPNYTHCDIKPENIMFKTINTHDYQKLYENNVEPVELYHEEYFQLKIIDFGLSTEGDPLTRLCKGGTKGYMPRDFGEKPHDKNDVVAIAMTLLDMEFNDHGFLQFSAIIGQLDIARKSNEEVGFSKAQIHNLKTHNFIKQVQVLVNTEEINLVFYDKIVSIFSAFENILSFKRFAAIPINNYMFKDPNLFEIIMYAAAKVYWNNFYIDVILKKRLADIENQKKELLPKINFETEKAKIDFLSEEMEYLNANLKLEEVNLKYRTRVINYCLHNIFSDYQHRSTVKVFMNNIGNLYKKISRKLENVVPVISSFEAIYFDSYDEIASDFLDDDMKNQRELSTKSVEKIHLI